MLTSKHVVAKKRQYLGIVLLFLGAALILIEFSSARMSDGRTIFYAGGYGESIGQFPNADANVSYSVSFVNPTKQVFEIYTVEPVLTEKGKRILNGRIIVLEEKKELKPGKKVTFTGEFKVDTSNLTEAEITNLMPLIAGYRVIFNRYEELIIPLTKESFKKL